MREENPLCSLCGRVIPNRDYLEKHHLIPVCRGGRKEPKIPVCVDCGDQLHQLFSEKELGREFNTLEALRKDDRVKKWVLWIRKQKSFGMCHKAKKKRK